MRKYYWECVWTNGKGGFDPDLECCTARGKAVHKTALAAAKAGVKHDEKHGWCGWGYAPPGRVNKTTLVYYKTPTGKEKCVGHCADIVAKGVKDGTVKDM